MEKGFIIKLSRCAGALTNIDTLRTRSPVIAVHWVQGNLCFKRDQSRLSELGGWVLVFATFTVCNRTMILGPTSPPSRAGGQLFVMVYLFWMTSATEQGLCHLATTVTVACVEDECESMANESILFSFSFPSESPQDSHREPSQASSGPQASADDGERDSGT